MAVVVGGRIRQTDGDLFNYFLAQMTKSKVSTLLEACAKRHVNYMTQALRIRTHALLQSKSIDAGSTTANARRIDVQGDKADVTHLKHDVIHRIERTSLCNATPFRARQLYIIAKLPRKLQMMFKG